VIPGNGTDLVDQHRVDEWLADESKALPGLKVRDLMAVAGHEKDLGVRLSLPYGLGRFNTVPVGHYDVRQHEAGSVPIVFQRAQACNSVYGDHETESGSFHRYGTRAQYRRLIVNTEDDVFRHGLFAYSLRRLHC